MKQNFTVRQAAPDGVDAFLSVGQHRNFRKAAEELGVTPSVGSPDYLRGRKRPERIDDLRGRASCMRRSNGSIVP
jgi:hypothetical protein